MTARPDDSEPARPYTVRTYQAGDEEAILELFNTVFGEGHDEFRPRTLEAWKWEFLDNPAGHQIVVAIEPSGRVIAHYACLPARVNDRGTDVLAGQGIDSMVHPDWRRGLKRKGPFIAVGEHFFKTWGHAGVSSFGFGYPNTKAFRIGVRIFGYTPVVERLPTLYRNFFEAPEDDEVGRGVKGSVRRVDSFGEEVDALWQRLRPSYPFAVTRDSRYLNWRYGQPPHLPYRLYEVHRDGALTGWFVTRAGWQDLPILGLVDFLAAPSDDASLALALRQAVRDAREQEQARIEAWFPSEHPFFTAAQQHGFQQEQCQYNLCIMLYRDEPTLEWVRDHWYYTIGDSDIF